MHPGAPLPDTVVKRASLRMPAKALKAAQAPEGLEATDGIDRHRSLVLRQEARVDALFHTTGFANRGAFEAAVRSHGGGQVLDFLSDETNFQFAMNHPESRRDGIVEKGFLNQFETGTSEGTQDIERRNGAESAMLGLKQATYAAFDPSMKPRYGYLRTTPTARAQLPLVDQYGSDTYIFKAARVRDHLTFTDNDSLLTSGCWSCDDFGHNWDQAFLPWKERALLANSIRLAHGEVHQTMNDQVPGMKIRVIHGQRYIELQYWKPLDLRDVESFEFGGQPPSGNFLKSLQDHGVKIFQRLPNGALKAWTSPPPAPVEPVKTEPLKSAA